MRILVDRPAGEAFLIQTALKASSVASGGGGSGRGRSAAKPMRLDVADGALPAIEWDEALIGQRARVHGGAPP